MRAWLTRNRGNVLQACGALGLGVCVGAWLGWAIGGVVFFVLVLVLGVAEERG